MQKAWNPSRLFAIFRPSMFQFPTHIIIISGGQTGVDRAALDFAIKYKIPCGGWCPKGRVAENGKISDKYPLKETANSAYSERTEKNILDSDATLIIHSFIIDNGTMLTTELCSKYNKLFFELNLEDGLKISELINWIQSNHIKVLNIAGPRESNSPGIYKKALVYLELVYKWENNICQE